MPALEPPPCTSTRISGCSCIKISANFSAKGCTEVEPAMQTAWAAGPGPPLQPQAPVRSGRLRRHTTSRCGRLAGRESGGSRYGVKVSLTSVGLQSNKAQTKGLNRRRLDHSLIIKGFSETQPRRNSGINLVNYFTIIDQLQP